MSPFSLLTQITTHINEVVLTQRPSPLIYPLSLLYKSLCLFYHLRCLALSYSMRYHNHLYLNSDISWKYFNQDNVFDSNAILSMCLLQLAAAYFPHVIFVAPNSLFWKLAYDLVVANGRHFADLNPQFSGHCHYRVPQLLKQIWQVVQILGNGNNIQGRFSIEKLPHFPALSPRIRTRLYGWVLLLNFDSGLYLIALTIACIASSACYLHMILLSESCWQFLISLLDFTLLSLLCIIGPECSLFFILVYYLLAFVYQKQSQAWQKELSLLLRSSSTKQPLGQILLARTFRQFHANHHQLTAYILHISQNVSNRGLFIIFASLLPSNVCIFSSLLIRPHVSLVNQALLGSILCCQFAVAIRLLIPMIRITNSLHCHRRWLVRMQWTLKDKLVMNKLKVARLYEQLNCEKQIGFAVGPLGAASWNAVFQFFFAYTGFIFFVVNLIRGMC